MSQNNLDKLLLLALFLTVVGDLLDLFIELQNQRQNCEKEDSEEAMKEEIRELQNEIKLMKMELLK